MTRDACDFSIARMACARRRAYHRPMNKGCSTMIAMKIQKRDEKSNDMANVLPVCRKLRPFDLVTSINVSDDAHAAFLLRLDLSHSGAAPSISALYHLDELRISFSAVKLLPIITLPGYRCRPFQRIGPT